MNKIKIGNRFAAVMLITSALIISYGCASQQSSSLTESSQSDIVSDTTESVISYQDNPTDEDYDESFYEDTSENNIPSESESSTNDALSIIQNAVLQYPSQNDDFKYNVYDTYIQITESLKVAEELVIPSEIDNLPVLVVGSLSDETSKYSDKDTISRIYTGDKLTKLVVSDGVAIIGREAFQFGNLKEVILPDSLIKINTYAFQQNEIETISFPEGLKSIGTSAFQNAFFFDGNYDRSASPEITLPKSLEQLHDQAFFSCNLKSITVLNSDLKIFNSGYGYPLVWDKDTMIYGYAQSTAAKAAAQIGSPFKVIS